MTADQKAVWNEQTKLTCSALNNIAVAIVVTGTVVPLISGQAVAASAQNVFTTLIPVIWWFGIGALLHAAVLKLMTRVKA